jgi:hypothetical protein
MENTILLHLLLPPLLRYCQQKKKKKRKVRGQKAKIPLGLCYKCCHYLAVFFYIFLSVNSFTFQRQKQPNKINKRKVKWLGMNCLEKGKRGRGRKRRR